MERGPEVLAAEAKFDASRGIMTWKLTGITGRRSSGHALTRIDHLKPSSAESSLRPRFCFVPGIMPVPGPGCVERRPTPVPPEAPGGLFDFDIVHGVLSWVTDSTRDAVLQTCARQPAPDGLAYLNYNIRPGWTVRGMVPEFLLRHTAGAGTPTPRRCTTWIGRCTNTSLPPTTTSGRSKPNRNPTLSQPERRLGYRKPRV